MTQWCVTAAGVLAVLALVAAARYRAVSATQRSRADRQQREIALLREQLNTELARRGGELAAVQQEQELNASTQRAFLSVARRILVMAHDQQALLDEMERTHDDPSLLEGLLKADHAAAQQARLAQTLAVLCGARAGRHWPEPVSLEDVVRGAQSRILPFQRVVVRSRIETAVVGAAAEALIHAVAELLDNATRYSPPSTQVFVTLMPVHNGAVIEIDDGGVGMPEQAVAKAASALAGGSALEVSRLGEVPQLGLAAVGRLSEQYGFRVTLSSAPSPYGGVRVVVLLPNALLTEPLPPTVPGLGHGDRAFSPAPLRGPEPPYRGSADHARTAGQHPPAGHPLLETPPTERPPAAGPATPPPLPRRSHRRDRASRHAAPAAPAQAPAPPYRSARDAQTFMTMFQAGTASGRSAARARAATEASPPPSPQLPQRSGEFHDHHP
ncbi:sensor histidine kinase [Kitasatospora sp. A2-31]|uniref:ATP-binding protein n=1 Tax=Kitasatospora sp. A2-31 TaxID=2916414 RepID=UPI001EE9E4DB|nr:ATP-binding protein [Kitasatospora sp. A2-31]MCG6494960.1 ATP-binding protein [Kitasatospora sp. A2-31]